MDDAGARGETGTDAAGDAADRGVETPEKLFSPEGDFMLIWGAAAGILTLLELFAGGLPTVLLGGGVAATASLLGAGANATRRFRPPVGFYLLVTLAAGVAAAAGFVYTDALVAPAGFGVVALANAGRVYEVGYRDSDSLLDPKRDDGDGTDGADESGPDEDGDSGGDPSPEGPAADER